MVKNILFKSEKIYVLSLIFLNKDTLPLFNNFF